MANDDSKVPILMYHSVSDRAHPRFRKFALAPTVFAAHLAYLAQQQYTTLTVSQYAAALKAHTSLPESTVVLTFDDGYADFHTTALPILERYGFVATLYVTTGFVNGTSRFLQRESETMRPMLTWEQLREIAAAGIECGAHSHWHAQLDVLPAESARDEIVRSKELLEERLAKPIASFAYPYGYYQATVKQFVQTAGYTSACAVRYRLSSRTDDLFALSRLIVTADTDLPRFIDLVSGRSAQLHPLYERSRALAWRCARYSMHLIKNDSRKERYDIIGA